MNFKSLYHSYSGRCYYFWFSLFGQILGGYYIYSLFIFGQPIRDRHFRQQPLPNPENNDLKTRAYYFQYFANRYLF